MSQATQFHGKTAQIYINGTEIGAINCHVDKKNDTYVSSTTKSRGVHQKRPGMADSSGSFEVLLDSAELIEAVLLITPGAIFALKQQLDAAGTYYQAAYVICESIAYPVDYNVELKATVNFAGTSVWSGSL
ncbi:MAG: hypothetical protein JWN86_1777 [Planctomycetota bacterium]|nr:hypothetical protein [Planctomycetota bacterium]